MKIVVVGNIKGGVAKTATVNTIATILSKKNKVLLVDMDPQGSTTEHNLEDPSRIIDNNIKHVLLKKLPISSAIIELSDNLKIIPSEISLELTQFELISHSDHMYTLYDMISMLDSEIDYCIIDTPGSGNLLSKMTFVAADIIVMPVKPEFWGIKGIDITMTVIEECENVRKYVKKESLKVIIVPTLYMKKRQVDETMLEAIQEAYPDICSKAIIPFSEDIKKVYTEPKEQLQEGDKGYDEYKQLVKEIING